MLKRINMRSFPEFPSMSEVQIKNFEKVFSVAKHAIKFNEHWKSLGYKYPKKPFLSYFFKMKKNPDLIKRMILKEYLFNAVMTAGIDVLGISYYHIQDHYGKIFLENAVDLMINKVDIKMDDDLDLWLSYTSTAYYHSLEKRLKDENLPIFDIDKLNNVLKLINLNYKIIFMDIFKNYKL